MLVHQLVVLPTPETLDYLGKVFSACPFNLDLSQAYVEINSSQTSMVPDTARIYTARAGNLQVFYDASTQQTSLLLPLHSPALESRVSELRESAPSAFYGEHYFPNLVLVRGMPPLARTYRSFIASVATTLASDPNQVLTFDAELVMSKDFHTIPDADYYESQLANNFARR
jgi:hypothetical protein